MRRTLLAVALLCPLALAGCVTALSTASSLLPYITTSLDVACKSSQTLAQQAAAQPALSKSSALIKVNSKIASICGVIDPTSAQVGIALNSLNTTTAALLGAAGAVGIKLPGL